MIDTWGDSSQVSLLWDAVMSANATAPAPRCSLGDSAIRLSPVSHKHTQMGFPPSSLRIEWAVSGERGPGQHFCQGCRMLAPGWDVPGDDSALFFFYSFQTVLVMLLSWRPLRVITSAKDIIMSFIIIAYVRLHGHGRVFNRLTSSAREETQCRTGVGLCLSYCLNLSWIWNRNVNSYETLELHQAFYVKQIWNIRFV